MTDAVQGRNKADFELSDADLDGFTLAELKCRACSGYGSCGFRMYRLHEGKPVLICQQRKQQLREKRAAGLYEPEDDAAESASEGESPSSDNASSRVGAKAPLKAPHAAAASASTTQRPGPPARRL